MDTLATEVATGSKSARLYGSHQIFQACDSDIFSIWTKSADVLSEIWQFKKKMETGFKWKGKEGIEVSDSVKERLKFIVKVIKAWFAC